MARKYFVVLERDGVGSPWRLEFGAYDREDLVAEVDGRRDHGVKASDLRVYWTFATRQSELDRLLTRENENDAARGLNSYSIGSARIVSDGFTLAKSSVPTPPMNDNSHIRLVSKEQTK
jgi:hypothetical protein